MNANTDGLKGDFSVFIKGFVQNFKLEGPLPTAAESAFSPDFVKHTIMFQRRMSCTADFGLFRVVCYEKVLNE